MTAHVCLVIQASINMLDCLFEGDTYFEVYVSKTAVHVLLFHSLRITSVYHAQKRV